MKIIGLSGTNGSGKDTVGHMLAERKGFLFVSVTEMLRGEAKKRGKSVDREQLRTISAQWRREHGLGVLIKKAVEYYKTQTKDYKGLVVASLRNPGEADLVHEYGGQVIWVDANPKVRYDRIQAHKNERDRAEEDNKTYEQFIEEEEIEMTPTGDETTLSMAAVKKKSDQVLLNEGNDIKAFKDYAEKAIKV